MPISAATFCAARRNSKSRCDQLKQEVDGTVRVASIYSVGLSEMVQLEQEFARRQPEAQLEVEYLRPEKVYAAVLADEADLGLVSYPGAEPRDHGDPVAAGGNGAGGVARSSAGEARQPIAPGGSERRRLHRLRRRSADPPRSGPLPARAGDRGES